MKAHEVGQQGRLRKRGHELSSAKAIRSETSAHQRFEQLGSHGGSKYWSMQNIADGQACLSLRSHFFHSLPRHNCDREGNDLQHGPKVRCEE